MIRSGHIIHHLELMENRGILKGKTEDGPGEVHEMRNLRDCLSDGIDPEGCAGYLYRNLHQVPGLHQGMSDRSKIF